MLLSNFSLTYKCLISLYHSQTFPNIVGIQCQRSCVLILSPESHVYFFKIFPFFCDCSLEKQNQKQKYEEVTKNLNGINYHNYRTAFQQNSSYCNTESSQRCYSEVSFLIGLSCSFSFMLQVLFKCLVMLAFILLKVLGSNLHGSYDAYEHSVQIGKL